MAINKLKTTLWLLPVAVLINMQVMNLLQNMIISCINLYHITFLAIPHNNMPCKNKLDVLYFVVANFTWLLRALARTVLTYTSKPQRVFIKFAVLTFNKDRA